MAEKSLKDESFKLIIKKGMVIIMMPRTVRLTLGGLYVALFVLVSRALPPIMLIPGVPVTLQNFVLAMMGFTLGLGTGPAACGAVLIMAFFGLPIMSTGGGPGILLSPTGGYIIGFLFVTAACGVYCSFVKPLLDGKKVMGIPVHFPVSFLFGMAGIILQYICGSIMLTVNAPSGKAFAAILISNTAFIPADMIKIALASSVSYFIAPRLNRHYTNSN